MSLHPHSKIMALKGSTLPPTSAKEKHRNFPRNSLSSKKMIEDKNPPFGGSRNFWIPEGGNRTDAQLGCDKIGVQKSYRIFPHFQGFWPIFNFSPSSLLHVERFHTPPEIVPISPYFWRICTIFSPKFVSKFVIAKLSHFFSLLVRNHVCSCMHANGLNILSP